MRASLACVIVCCLSAPLMAAQKNSALVTQVKGAVSFTMPVPEAEAIPVRAFQRARVDDTYTLSENASIRLVYTSTGRQELWSGPASFRIGTTESSRLQGVNPQIKQLPAVGAKAIRTVPKLLKRAGRARIGAVRLRSAGTKAPAPWRDVDGLSEPELREFRDSMAGYKEWRKNAESNDPTPDLVLISQLSRMRLRAELLAAIVDAKRRFPGDSSFSVLLRWLEKEGQPKAGSSSRDKTPPGETGAPNTRVPASESSQDR